MSSAASLILGGHSFIQALGNDPVPDRARCAEIVSACLAHGITWFDTTYQPERILLRQALADAENPAQAKVIVWNFFQEPTVSGDLGGPEPWRDEHLDVVRRQIGRDHLDVVVVHDVDDAEADRRQRDVVQTWQARGFVGRLAAWAPPTSRIMQPPAPFAMQVLPLNPASHEHLPRFRDARASGWQSWACSPFVRGWHLDQAVERSGEPRSVIAERMLRYALHAPGVDGLIVSMRRPEWVTANAASAMASPLPLVERRRLEVLCESSA